jgi:hypothetical protein
MYKPGPIRAKPLSALLGDVFSDAYAKQGFAARELVTRWAEIAGPDIAKYCEPLKMQWPRPVEGQPQEPATLVLRVEGPMALEIQHTSDVILQRVNRFFGWSAVGRLALRQAPLARRKRFAPPPPRIPNRWQRSPKACRRSRTTTCARRWRGLARRSSEIESRQIAARHCHDGQFKLANGSPLYAFRPRQSGSSL